jgi:hypothetical protein
MRILFYLIILNINYHHILIFFFLLLVWLNVFKGVVFGLKDILFSLILVVDLVIFSKVSLDDTKKQFNEKACEECNNSNR